MSPHITESNKTKLLAFLVSRPAAGEASLKSWGRDQRPQLTGSQVEEIADALVAEGKATTEARDLGRRVWRAVARRPEPPPLDVATGGSRQASTSPTVNDVVAELSEEAEAVARPAASKTVAPILGPDGFPPADPAPSPAVAPRAPAAASAPVAPEPEPDRKADVSPESPAPAPELTPAPPPERDASVTQATPPAPASVTPATEPPAAPPSEPCASAPAPELTPRLAALSEHELRALTFSVLLGLPPAQWAAVHAAVEALHDANEQLNRAYESKGAAVGRLADALGLPAVAARAPAPDAAPVAAPATPPAADRELNLPPAARKVLGALRKRKTPIKAAALAESMGLPAGTTSGSLSTLRGLGLAEPTTDGWKAVAA